MAPMKRKADDEAEPANKSPAESTRMVTRGSEAAARRQTRSSTQGSGGKSEKPVKQKAAAARKKSKKKKAAKPEQEDKEVKSEEEEEDKVEAEEVNMKTVVIERCTQCNAFKTRAEQVKASLECLPGITVSINPVKPRRGCFEIREEGGEKFISLLDMKRPFKPMKDLNMQEVIDNIIQKIQ